MKTTKIVLLVFALIAFGASSAFASLSYDVTVDTSSLNGTSGYLYFQYGGLNAVDSAATVFGFTGGTLDALPSENVVDGSAVSGQLPGPVVFANTNGINDYNHGILFGNTLSFGVSFAATAFGAPDGGSSTFSLGLFSDEFGLNPIYNLQGSNNSVPGTLFTINLMNNGSASSEIIAGQANVTNGTGVSPVPVPAALWLFGSGLAGLAGIRKRIQR
jgi:hypothetical protein